MTFSSLFHTHVVSFVFPVYVVAELGILAMVWHGLALFAVFVLDFLVAVL